MKLINLLFLASASMAILAVSAQDDNSTATPLMSNMTDVNATGDGDFDLSALGNGSDALGANTTQGTSLTDKRDKRDRLRKIRGEEDASTTTSR